MPDFIFRQQYCYMLYSTAKVFGIFGDDIPAFVNLIISIFIYKQTSRQSYE